MGRQEQWDEIEQTYLEMKEQELEQVDMSELWSRIDEKLEQNQEEPEKKKKQRGIKRKTAIFWDAGCGSFVGGSLCYGDAYKRSF